MLHDPLQCNKHISGNDELTTATFSVHFVIGCKYPDRFSLIYVLQEKVQVYYIDSFL
jgi:hypothetical protein